MRDKCLVCERIEMAREGKNQYLVREVKSGYVVIGDFQVYEGYTLLLCREHVDELHELEPGLRRQLMEDLVLVGEAVYKAFGADKLNYELLGNTERNHVHWHIFPRRESDPGLQGAVWLRGKGVVYAEESRPSEKELIGLKTKLADELERVLKKNDY